MSLTQCASRGPVAVCHIRAVFRALWLAFSFLVNVPKLLCGFCVLVTLTDLQPPLPRGNRGDDYSRDRPTIIVHNVDIKELAAANQQHVSRSGGCHGFDQGGGDSPYMSLCHHRQAVTELANLKRTVQ